MKRANNLYAAIYEMENLRLAYWKARKSKEGKQEVIEFTKQLEQNLLKIRQQLISGNFDIGNYHYFTI